MYEYIRYAKCYKKLQGNIFVKKFSNILIHSNIRHTLHNSVIIVTKKICYLTSETILYWFKMYFISLITLNGNYYSCSVSKHGTQYPRLNKRCDRELPVVHKINMKGENHMFWISIVLALFLMAQFNIMESSPSRGHFFTECLFTCLHIQTEPNLVVHCMTHSRS